MARTRCGYTGPLPPCEPTKVNYARGRALVRFGTPPTPWRAWSTGAQRRILCNTRVRLRPYGTLNRSDASGWIAGRRDGQHAAHDRPARQTAVWG